jgi:hypothetical protein
MTRQQKILLAVVALIVVLFVTGVASQGRSGPGSASAGNGLVSWLGGLIGESATVEPGDISADCLEPPDRLTVTGTCTLRVAARDGGMRQLDLRTEKEVTISARAPRGTDTVTDTVAAGEAATVAVDEEGGEVVIQCGGSEPCVVTLGGEEEK